MHVEPATSGPTKRPSAEKLRRTTTLGTPSDKQPMNRPAKRLRTGEPEVGGSNVHQGLLNSQQVRQRHTKHQESGNVSTTVDHVFAIQLNVDGSAALPAGGIDKVLTEFSPSLPVHFVCHSRTALISFGQHLAADLRNAPVVPIIRVDLLIFDDFEKSSDLLAWSGIDMAHGHDIDVHGHMKAWINAVQHLPQSVEVDLVMSYPWRDYRSLRGVTLALRQGETGRKIGVQVRREA